LEAPTQPWTHLSVDFVVGLPISQGASNIMVVCDRFTKMSHFIAMPTITVPATAAAFMDQVVRLHGLPLDIVSNCGSQFVSTFWSALTDALGIKLSLSTTAHQQTDGQSEHTIQTMEQYLRHFVAYLQDNWSVHLAMAEFAFNNLHNASTKKLPFEDEGAIFGVPSSYKCNQNQSFVKSITVNIIMALYYGLLFFPKIGWITF
jgi:chemotaxis protein CheY-P-specific phosphatase CheC